jgi:hypothetical protein
MSSLTHAARLTGYEELARSLELDPRGEVRNVGIPVNSLRDPEA